MTPLRNNTETKCWHCETLIPVGAGVKGSFEREFYHKECYPKMIQQMSFVVPLGAIPMGSAGPYERGETLFPGPRDRGV